jgi:hypothetical protein
MGNVIEELSLADHKLKLRTVDNRWLELELMEKINMTEPYEMPYANKKKNRGEWFEYKDYNK